MITAPESFDVRFSTSPTLDGAEAMTRDPAPAHPEDSVWQQLAADRRAGGDQP